MNISILIVTNDFEKWILKKVSIMKKLLFKNMEPVIIIYQQEKKLILSY